MWSLKHFPFKMMQDSRHFNPMLAALALCIRRMKKTRSDIQGVPTSMISTGTNFQKVLHKVVLVGDLISKLVLVELTVCTTQLVQILHSTIFFQVPKIVLSGD